MAESRKDSPIAPRRSLGGPILPPPPAELSEDAEPRGKQARKGSRDTSPAGSDTGSGQKPDPGAFTSVAEDEDTSDRTSRQEKGAGARRTAASPGRPRRTRRAQLRLVQVDAWSVMKTSFLLSIALGIMLVVAVAIIWAVLGAAGVWESINSIVDQAVGTGDGQAFDITDYVGTSRVLGLTMVVAAFDVILITAIATLGAFLYNLSAALLGGVEVTLAEDS